MKKILYTRNTTSQDYLADCVFHGLHQLDDLEITDAPRMWYMYSNEFKPKGSRNLSDIYGRGFTMWGHMEETSIDRSDIEQKIVNHYFDLVICSRTDEASPYIELILEHYKANDIISLCGRDEIHIDPRLIGNSSYFIREIINEQNNGKYPGGWNWPEFNSDRVFPISFAFPKVKIQTPLPKTRAWSNVQPGWGAQYVHHTEQDYYNDYRQSLFGRTTKKSGWDCMRHYEIMACRCIPYFADLDGAPRNLMTTLPRDLLLHAKRRVDEQGVEYFMPGQPGWNEYQELEQKIFDHFLANCTTGSLAKYVLDTHQTQSI